MGGYMADEVLTEVRGRVLLIRLNRPEAMNAFNAAQGNALEAAINELNNNAGLTAGVLTGSDRVFSAGMDLKAFAAGESMDALGRFFRNGAKKPLIAAVERFALAGGLEAALTCDLIVGAKGSRFGIPEVGVGLFAAGGAMLRLPQRVPYGVAMEMALTADPITAEQAHEYGLVTRLAEPGEAIEVAMTLAERIAKNAPLGVAASKQMLSATQGRTDEEFWEKQKQVAAKVWSSNDAKEGPAAFAQKREPQWSGS
jgi:enoyl-CoA hydratase